MRVLPPKAILDRLNQRFHLLTGGARDVDARHQTLHATLDWSYDLLDEAEKTLFARLSVFTGGFRIEAAEEIADPDRDLSLSVVDGILALAEKSLLREREDFDGNPRFWMLESIRSYAGERFATSPERRRIADAHLQHYVRFANNAEPHWRDPDKPYYATNTNHLIGTLLSASDIELGLGDGAAAMVLAEQALARAAETNDTFQLPDAHRSVAHAALLVGEYERAGHHAQLADEAELRVRPTSGLSRLQEELRVVRASIAAATGETDLALAEWRKTQRSLEESGRQLSLPVQRLAERYLVGGAGAAPAEPPTTFDQFPSTQPRT